MDVEKQAHLGTKVDKLAANASMNWKVNEVME
jgi:hypothetical protein